MIYVKSKHTGQCYAIYDYTALQYNGWLFITREEFEEYNRKMGF